MKTVMTFFSAALMALPVFTAGCSDDPVTIPEGYNTGRTRLLTANFFDKKTGDGEFVQPLNGLHGSPLAIVGGYSDLTPNYWGRTASSPDEVDGAHVRVVRIGTDTICDLSLEGIFPNKSRDPDDPANYEFGELDKHAQAIQDLNTADITFQAAFNPGGTCSVGSPGVQVGGPIAAADASLYATVAYNIMRHLRSPGTSGETWDPLAKNLNRANMFEFADDPVGEMGYPSDTDQASWQTLFQTYADVAGRIKTEWPDQTDNEGNTSARVRVGGMSFSFTASQFSDVANIPTAGAGQHPLFAFVDFCRNNDAPLDYVSFKTKTTTPQLAFQIAEKIRDYLVDKNMSDVKLFLTEFVPDYDDLSYVNATLFDTKFDPDGRFKSAHLGAFQTAVRLLVQDAGVTWALAGRGPAVFNDLLSHAGENPNNLGIINSSYFAQDGTAQPAFMALFPFRQVPGFRRFNITSDDPDANFAIMGAHPTTTDDHIHIIIANANVNSGIYKASITYDLRIDWLPGTTDPVDYRLAVLDRNADGCPLPTPAQCLLPDAPNTCCVSDFQFTEVGKIDPTGFGKIRFVHEMAIPSVHYLTFSLPQ